MVLPRRSYPPLAGRLLHDHTADRIARRVSRVRHKVETIHARRTRAAAHREPDPPAGADPIGSLRQPGRATVQGRMQTAEVRPGLPAGSGCVAWSASATTAVPP